MFRKPSLLKLAYCTLFVLGTLPLLRAQAPTHTRHFTPVLDANINGFYEYLPRNYAADVTKKYPLMVFFHGVGESGSTPSNAVLDNVLKWGPPQLINNKMINKAAPAAQFPDSFFVGGQWFKFIVISPQIKAGLDATTTDTIRPSTVDAVIEYAKATYRVDLSRIYLCGLSMGGGATWDYAGSSAVAANKLAAIVVACGAGDLSTAEANIIAAAKIPVLSTHNNGDPTVVIARTKANITKLNAYLPSLVPVPKAVYWFTGMHNVWSRTYEDINPGVTSQSLSGNLRDTLGMNAYEWMLQFSRPSALLPLRWESFSVTEKEGAVILSWTTVQQAGNSNYTIERSNDGGHWSGISTIAAVNTTGHTQTYKYKDADLPGGSYFYRIKQMDADGAFSYSSVKKITGADNRFSTKIFPNPFQDRVMFHCRGVMGTSISIKLINTAGYVFIQEQHHLNSGYDIFSIGNLKMLSNGVYYAIVENEAGAVLSRTRLLKE